MFEILTLAASLFTATPATAQEATPVAAPAPATTAPAQAPSIWQSLGNQVIAHDTIVGMDTDQSGAVSHDEWTAYQEAQFKALDKNGDGSLSADEVGTSKRKSLTSFW